MTNKTVAITLSARVDQYEAAMARAAGASSKFASATKGNLSQLGGQMSSLGGAMTAGLTVPLAAGGAAAVKMSTDFSGAFTRMQSLAGVTAGEVDGLKSSVLALSTATGRGPQELAEALYFLRSSGLDGAEAMDALKVSAEASAAGLGSTATIADAVSSAMNAYAKSGLEAAQATDILVATARAGKAEPEELAGALGRVLPIASELGITFDDVGGAIAALSLSGNNATISATLLTNVMSKLLKPSQQGAEALEKVGLSTQAIRDSLADQGLLGTLDMLKAQLGDSGFVKFLEDAQAVQGALALTGQNADKVREVFDDVKNSAGATGEAFATVASSDGFKMQQAWAEMQKSMIEVGDQLVPIAASIASGIASVTSAFSSLPGPVKTGVLALMGLVGAAGPILLAAGKIVDAYQKVKVAQAGSAAGGGAGAGAGSALFAGGVVGTIAVGALMEWNEQQQLAEHDAAATTAAVLEQGNAFTGLASYIGEAAAANPALQATMDASKIKVEDVARAALAGGDAWEQMADKLSDVKFPEGGAAFEDVDEIIRLVDDLPERAKNAQAALAATNIWGGVTEGVAGAAAAVKKMAASTGTATASVEALGAAVTPVGAQLALKFSTAQEETDAYTQAIATAQQAVLSYSGAIRSTDWGQVSLQAAQGEFQKFGGQVVDMFQILASRQDTVASFKETMKEGFNFGDLSKNSGEALSSLKAVSTIVEDELSFAFRDAGGNAEAFMASASQIGDKLIGDLGLTGDKAEQLRSTLKLTAGDYEARFKLAVDAEGLAKLEILQSALGGVMTDDQKLKIGFQILDGDIEGALQSVRDIANAEDFKVTVDVTANVLEAEGALAGLTEVERQAIVTALANIANANGALTNLSTEERIARIQAVANIAAADGDLSSISDIERQTIINAIAETAVANGEFATVEEAQRQTKIELDPLVDAFNGAVSTATSPKTTPVTLQSDGTIHGAPRTISVTAVISAPRMGAGRVMGGQTADGGIYGDPFGSRFGPARLRAYANGGMTDARIWPEGAGTQVGMFNEPGTGGEAVIPMGMGKRPQALSVLGEVVRRFGMAAFADGGVMGAAMSSQVPSSVPNLVMPLWLKDVLARSGSTAAEFAAAAKGGPEAMDKFIDRLRSQGIVSDDLLKVMKALVREHDRMIGRIERENDVSTPSPGGEGGGGGGTDGTAGPGGDEAEAAQALSDQLMAQAEAFETATNANYEYSIALRSSDWGLAAAEAATDAFSKYTDGLFAAADAALDRQEAVASFFEVLANSQQLGEGEEDPTGMVRFGRAIDEINASGGFGILAGQAREFNSALHEIADSVGAELATAFANSNMDAAAFMATAAEIGDRVIADLHLTGEAAEQVRAQLGLTAGDYEARFSLAGDLEAKARLALLQSALTALGNDEVTVRIGALVAQGDFTGALTLAQQALDANAVDVRTQADTKETENALKELADEERIAVIQVHLNTAGIAHDFAQLIADLQAGRVPVAPTMHAGGGSAGPFGGIYGETGWPEIANGRVATSPTWVPPGTKVTGVAQTSQLLRSMQGGGGGGPLRLDRGEMRELAVMVAGALNGTGEQMAREYARSMRRERRAG